MTEKPDRWYQDTFPVQRKLKGVPHGIWRGRHVLEFGCNLGGLGDYSRSHGAAGYVGYDQSPVYIEEGRKRHPDTDLRVGRIQDLVADPETFAGRDMVVLLGVLHHLPEDAVEQLFSALPVTVSSLLLEHPMSSAPLNRYYMRDRDWYRALLDRHGWLVPAVEYQYGFTYPTDRPIWYTWRDRAEDLAA